MGLDTSTNVAQSAAGMAYTGKTAGACWGDFDNDGLLDLFVANYREDG